MERKGKNLRNANPYIARMMAEEERRRHDALVRRGGLKSGIDNKDPYAAAPHRKRNPKKEALMEEHYARIEQENLILLGRMVRGPRARVGESARGTGPDRRLRRPRPLPRPQYSILSSSTSFASLERFGPRSMNINQRRKDLERIADANQVR